jgi:plastocyanin
MSRKWWIAILALTVVVVVALAAKVASAQQPTRSQVDRQQATQQVDRQQDEKRRHAKAMIIVPGEDRFTPFETTVTEGDRVDFVNQDTDDHTLVSDDAVSDGGPRGVDMGLPGTDSNHGQPGTISIVFWRPGTWVFYCRFHSHLDDHHQPVAPGPHGGIQDDNGNYGTPMMGIVHVLSSNG